MSFRDAEEIWVAIKEKSWDKFPTQRIFIDNENFIMVMRRNDNTVVVVGFLHFKIMKLFQESEDSKSLSHVNNAHSFPLFREYVAKLCSFKSGKYGNSDLVLLLNRELESIDYSLLEELPQEIKYFYYDESRAVFLPQDLEVAVKRNKETPRYTVQILPDRKLIDNEDVIMRALREGEGDHFGY
ncbi:hypothetical protein [Draconibacterium sediminis]|uniref:hypothetical protein n=1 Tax=Draconibacterium sediminis TaxID=1544798 RepID=UPI0026EBFF95|nr:hypothetical protein [Draconibacterium sediminis]